MSNTDNTDMQNSPLQSAPSDRIAGDTGVAVFSEATRARPISDSENPIIGEFGYIPKGLTEINPDVIRRTYPEVIKCPKCDACLPGNAKFCSSCGEKIFFLKENEMLCPLCGAKTVKGKFCTECGTSLIRKCPNCGAAVPPGGKFCPECAADMK